MRVRMWLTGLSIGSLALTGMIAAGPLTGSAQETSTPPAAQSAQQTAGEDEQTSGPAIVGTPLLQPSIDLMRAQEIAVQDQSGAVVTEVGLDGEDGVLAYSIALDNGVEVDVDATSGKVLKTEQVDENDDDGNGSDERENENGSQHENGSEGEDESESEQG